MKIKTLKGHTAIARGLRTLLQEMKHESAVLPETTLGRMQRVLKIYRGIKPLLAILASFPLIPASSRESLALFAEALEALSLSVSELTTRVEGAEGALKQST